MTVETEGTAESPMVQNDRQKQSGDCLEQQVASVFFDARRNNLGNAPTARKVIALVREQVAREIEAEIWSGAYGEGIRYGLSKAVYVARGAST